MNILSARVSKLRRSRGLTQRQFADALGIRRHTVRDLEAGICPRNIIQIIREIHKIFGVPSAQLIGIPSKKVRLHETAKDLEILVKKLVQNLDE